MSSIFYWYSIISLLSEIASEMDSETASETGSECPSAKVSWVEIKFGIEQFKFFKLNSNCLTVSVCHQTWLQTIFQTNLISNWCELWDCEQFDIKFMRVMELQTSANFANYCELCELFQTLSLRIVWFQILSNCSLAN